MTDPTRWEQVKALFDEAAELPPEERSALLDARCGDDTALRADVESLLSSHDAPDAGFETQALHAAHALLQDDLEGHRLGPYRVMTRVGSGGMGAVYRAVRADAAFEKQVAIKVVKRGMDSEEILRRFREERQTLARLEHPNIARLLDGGTTADGRPFLVMEFVEGTRIDRYCDTARLSIDDRLRLFQRVCRAVQHAHQNLIIHRDLKPDNILVTREGEPKLVDFGIAKMLAGPANVEAAVTQPAERRMTLAYSSPEQVRGEAITTSSDVYSLGVILYELLTGHRMHREAIASPAAYERALDAEPTAPSTRVRVRAAQPSADARVPPVDEIAALRQTTSHGLARALAGDIDTIVLKAVQPDTARRYASAQQLADDIDRYLAGMPVLAQPDSARYRAAKFVRRHRAGVAALVVVGMALAGGLAGTLWQARVAAGERDRAQNEARRAQQISAFLQNMLGSADPDARGREVTVAEVLDDAARRAAVELAGQPDELAAIRTTIGVTYLKLGRAAQAEPLLRQALAARDERLGRNHPETIDVLHELANALAALGKRDEAEREFLQVLELRRRTSGQESAEVARALDGLGSLKTAKGQLNEAASLHRDALAVRRRVLADGDPELVNSLNNLGVALGTLGRWEEALPLHQEAYALVLRVRGREHRDTAAVMKTLGFVLETVGRVAEAEQYFRDALDIERRILGADHPDAAFTAYNYASLLQASGHHPRALALTDEILSLRGRTLNEEHPVVAATLQVRGLSLAALGRHGEAEESLRDSLSVRTRTLPADHWLTASAKSRLGEHLANQRRFAAAEPLLKEGYEGLRRNFGEDDRRTRDAVARLAALYDGWGRSREAQRYRPASVR